MKTCVCMYLASHLVELVDDKNGHLLNVVNLAALLRTEKVWSADSYWQCHSYVKNVVFMQV